MTGNVFASYLPAAQSLQGRGHSRILLAVLLLIALLWAGFVNGAALRADDGAKEDKAHAKNGEPKEGKDTANHPPHDAAKPGHGEEPSAMDHVMDTRKWEFFEKLGLEFELPRPLTKFMVLEVIAAGLILLIYIPLAKRMQSGDPAKGWKDNMWEVLLAFIRDQVAKPAIGEHDADKYVPFLWTLFLFILFNNLLGMVPFGASPTASIYVTGALAVCVFFAIHGSAIAKQGFVHYLKSFWLQMDLPIVMKQIIQTLIFVLELVGVLVRNLVLAVRLFANMFAGHMVTGTILLFIVTAAHSGFLLWGTVTISSVLGVVLLSLLELFVAFLQSYIFVFLAAVFMGMALHPQH
jgi:F-type H+-transporting ATPase subunit a